MTLSLSLILSTEVEQGDDRDDGDESKDQCVFREALTVLVLVGPRHEPQSFETCTARSPPSGQAARARDWWQPLARCQWLNPRIMATSCPAEGPLATSRWSSYVHPGTARVKNDAGRLATGRRRLSERRARTRPSCRRCRGSSTWPPRKIRATIATMAMRARISAYSARPWPSSSRTISEEMSAFSIGGLPPFLEAHAFRRGDVPRYGGGALMSTPFDASPVLPTHRRSAFFTPRKPTGRRAGSFGRSRPSCRPSTGSSTPVRRGRSGRRSRRWR